MSMFGFCAWCGIEFKKSSSNERYCCDECRELATRERHIINQNAPKKIKPTGANAEIARIAKLARDHHMTYGQYVQAVSLGQIVE